MYLIVFFAAFYRQFSKAYDDDDDVYVCRVKQYSNSHLMVCCFRIVSRAFSAVITFHNR